MPNLQLFGRLPNIKKRVKIRKCACRLLCRWTEQNEMPPPVDSILPRFQKMEIWNYESVYNHVLCGKRIDSFFTLHSHAALHLSLSKFTIASSSHKTTNKWNFNGDISVFLSGELSATQTTKAKLSISPHFNSLMSRRNKRYKRDLVSFPSNRNVFDFITYCTNLYNLIRLISIWTLLQKWRKTTLLGGTQESSSVRLHMCVL